MDEFVRIFLFSGLIIHKIVWEVMKRDSKASQQVKTTHKKRLIKLAKVAFLVFLLLQIVFLPNILPLSSTPCNFQTIGLIIFSLGLGLAILGRIQLGSNWANLEEYQILSEQQLVRSGIYRLIRHPIYSGDVLLILGLELALNSWFFLIVIPLSIFVYRQALAEEKILRNAYPGYLEYQNETKMFIPFVV